MEKTKFDYVIDFIKKSFETDNILYSKFGHKVYLVGGCVRDEIMGLPVKDIDIMVDLPDGGIRFAETMVKKYPNICKNLVLFPRFGTSKFTITVSINNIDESVDIECVMPRSEFYEDKSRKPIGVYYTSLKEDAIRRDFTVNALYKDILTNDIVDPTGFGIKDIKTMTLRCTNEPEFIFKEDPLRMMRAIRFICCKGFDPKYNIIESLNNCSSYLKNISFERINDEFSKIICSDNVDKGIRCLIDTKLMQYIIPELMKCYKFEHYSIYHDKNVLDHIINTVKLSKPILTHRLAALFHDIGKPYIYQDYIENDILVKRTFHGHIEKSAEIAQICLARLKYSNDIIDEVCFAIKHHNILKDFKDDSGDLKIPDKTVRKIHRKIFNYYDIVLDLIDADNKSHVLRYSSTQQIEQFKNKVESLNIKNEKRVLLVDGYDIMDAFNIKPCLAVKVLLQMAEEFVDTYPEATKQEIIDYLKRNY